MSLADDIRAMDDEELAEFLVWDVPDECDGCEQENTGCAFACDHDKRTERMLKLLQEDAE